MGQKKFPKKAEGQASGIAAERIFTTNFNRLLTEWPQRDMDDKLVELLDGLDEDTRNRLVHQLASAEAATSTAAEVTKRHLILVARKWAAMADAAGEAGEEEGVDATPTPQLEPPGLGVLLVGVFAPKDTAEAVIGDLEERFHELAGLRGQARARAWYWRQVGWVGLAFGWRWLQRLLALDDMLTRLGL